LLQTLYEEYAMNNGKLDANIPVLTEIIEPLPTLTDVIEMPRTAPAIESDHFELPQPRQEPTLSQKDWDRLAAEVQQKVLRQLQDRIDFVIEQRVRDGLADVLQTAVEGMAAQIRAGLHQTFDEVICRAITLELVKLHKQNL
jgi:hypothetical protein